MILPKTPYPEDLGFPDILGFWKYALTEQFQRLNPFHLRKAMEEKLKRIFRYAAKRFAESFRSFGNIFL